MLPGWRIFPRPGLCAHGRAGLRQPLTHIRARDVGLACAAHAGGSAAAGGMRASCAGPGPTAGHSARPGPCAKRGRPPAAEER